MNIILPIGGRGERFQKEGYTLPKPLLPIFEKPMIEYVLDHLTYDVTQDEVFIIYNTHLDAYNFSDVIKRKYPHIHLINIDKQTRGACETLLLGIQEIFTSYDYNEKTILLDCDTFYTQDIVSVFREYNENMVFYVKNTSPNPIYSYIELDQDQMILNIAEKKKISDNANIGTYAFRNIYEFYDSCKYVLENNINFNGEPYTSCAIHVLLENKNIFKGYEVSNNRVFSLGTPKELTTYIENTHAFLFDLDGTMIISDEIYVNVWKNIVKNYNIDMTMEIFKKYIQGNSDQSVMDTLLSDINIDVSKISRLKDEGFIEHISMIEIIPGIKDLLRLLYEEGHKCCIVTNCNRSVANRIIEYMDIGKYIDFVITANDCSKGKPDPEPYLKAIDRYHIQPEKCIIFEDSKTGLLSGKTVNPKYLIGIETLYDSVEMKKYGVDFSMENFIGFQWNKYILEKTTTIDELEQLILKNTNFDEVSINTKKYKGGFIADVMGFKAIRDKTVTDYVIKLENTNANSLSDMANRLRLYEREYYIYEHLSNIIPLKLPKYISVIKDDLGNKRGIVLENLASKEDFALNLNLNSESIDVSLKIIDAMARLHSKFWGKNIPAKYPGLKTNDDPIFRPFLQEFIDGRMDIFKQKWKPTLSDTDMNIYETMKRQFSDIQLRLCGKNTTLLHGDVKSPNIFYDRRNGDEPYFLDWQHSGIGKGVQDFIFFVIESFDSVHMKLMFPIFKIYYYKKLLEYGVLNYSMEDYTKDLLDATCYIPFLTAVWFGSTPNDELIDKNFPYFFIKKHLCVFHMLNNYK
jgi:HAD superfamily hydrolase (TIGR01509 family)